MALRKFNNENVLPKSIQLIAGRTGRKYNQRENRKGVFWVEEILKNESNRRDAKWTESIGVGDKEFLLETKTRAIGREVLEENGVYKLREFQTPSHRSR